MLGARSLKCINDSNSSEEKHAIKIFYKSKARNGHVRL